VRDRRDLVGAKAGRGLRQLHAEFRPIAARVELTVREIVVLGPIGHDEANRGHHLGGLLEEGGAIARRLEDLFGKPCGLARQVLRVERGDLGTKGFEGSPDDALGIDPDPREHEREEGGEGPPQVEGHGARVDSRDRVEDFGWTGQRKTAAYDVDAVADGGEGQGPTGVVEP
jgi:hypothetical protein